MHFLKVTSPFISVLCAQNPLISIAIPSNLMQNADTESTQASLQDLHKVMPVLKEGQEFEDANALHKALKEYAKRSNFQYKRTMSGGGHFQAKCIKNDCLWCIRACKLLDKPTFKIKFLKGNHTCNVANKPTM